MNTKIIQTLLGIIKISNNSKLRFNNKLHKILLEITYCMNTKKGSIMILKGKKYLEVIASTRPELIGKKQHIDTDSPSTWVVKNKKSLYSDELSNIVFSNKSDNRYTKEAFLLAPILSNSRVIGVINVTEKDGPDNFSREEQEILLTIAGYMISSIESHRLANSLKKSKQSLRKKNIQLKKLEQIRTELFNMLIHDLKGPISEVVAYLDILTYTSVGENLDYVESAQTGCDNLLRMISDLLDITRLEDGSLKLIYEVIPPDSLIEEALTRLKGFAKKKEITFKKDIDEQNNNKFIYGDREILLRILQNLLMNAIQYSPRGKIVEAGCRFMENDSVEFFVKDHGPGIPQKLQDSIFDKFVQIGKKNTGIKYTTGLGLTFCRLAVNAHKGEILVESDGIEGSHFKFIIPPQQN